MNAILSNTMTPDTIVDVYCEICEERIAQVRVGDLKYPMTGAMFLSPDPLHGFPAPFDPATDWEWIRCPHCRFRPFLCEDRVNTGDRFIYATKDQDAEELPQAEPEPVAEVTMSEISCAVCGKKFPPAQMKAHQKNHRRADNRRKQKARD